MRSRHARPDRDAGFTLPELLIAIVLMGILAPVVAAAFTVIVRNTPSVQTRADDSRSTRGLSTWLPQDVLSTPPNVITDNTSSAPGYNVDTNRGSACSGTSGTNVVHMIWQENAGTLTTYVANYRAITSGGVTQIKRYSCSGTGSAPYSNTRTLNVTTSIKITAGYAPTATPVTASGVFRFIDVKVQTDAGLEVLIRAASRNPAEQLPNS